MSRHLDLIIRNGTVVDGSGGKPYVADIGVRDGRIACIGQLANSCEEEIDAGGCMVTPGFVDIHTHYDGQITWEHRLRPSSDHGVTTVVMGNCGVGFAPVRPNETQMVIKLMEGVEDIPEVVMAQGVPFDWESFPDYLDFLEQRSADIDFAAQLPHSPLRVYVMGQRGADLEPATEADLAEMRRLTTEAVKAGALGVSTSRNLAHRFRDGRLAPSVSSADLELLALAEGLRDAGTGVYQLIPDMTQPAAAEFDLIERIADTAGRPVSFTLVTDDERISGWQDYLTGLNRTDAAGKPIKGQYLPRPVGFLFGLDLSFHPFSLNPSYQPIADLPLAQKVAALRDPDLRRRLLAEEPEHTNPQMVWLVRQTRLLFRLTEPLDYLPAFDRSIGARAAGLGVTNRELIYDELLEDDGRAILYCPTRNMTGGRMDAASAMFDQPGVVLGLGDGGAHYGTICDAAYPTFLLTQYVRDGVDGRHLPLAKAIRMLARETAQAVGLNDRGLLQPGYKADINVIDLDRLTLHVPEAIRDLPSGGRRMVQRAQGYCATIVSGKVTYREGLATGALPGRLIRGQQDEPGIGSLSQLETIG